MRSRLVPIIGLSLAFIGLIGGISILATGKPDKGALTIVGTDTVQEVYGGIEQQGAALGKTGSPVTISVFNDLQCAGCDTWFVRTVPPLVNDLVRKNKAKMIYHHFPMGQRDKEVGFNAAEAAGEQGYQWQYIHIFFANQDKARKGVTEKFMTRVAEQVPQFDVKKWESDRKDPKISAEINATLAADAKLALDLRLPVKPAVVVDGPAGRRKLVQAPTVAQIEEAVQQVQ